MGKIYADSPEHPVSAMALIAGFCFFAGKPDAELVRYWPELCTADPAEPSQPDTSDPSPADSDKPSPSRCIIMVPQNRWSVALAEKLGYHFDHEYAAYDVKENYEN